MNKRQAKKQRKKALKKAKQAIDEIAVAFNLLARCTANLVSMIIDAFSKMPVEEIKKIIEEKNNEKISDFQSTEN